MATPETIVFIHGGAIGDLVQTLPAMAAVRAARPEARVTLIGRPERAALAVLAGAADAVVDIETCGLWRRMGEGEAPALPVLDSADVVVDCFTQGRLAPGPEKRTASQDRPSHTGQRIVSVDPLPPQGRDRSAAAWVLDQVRDALGLGAPSETPQIALSPAAEEATRTLLASRGVGERFVAIHPGSGSTKKNWPAGRFAHVARRIRGESRRNIVWLAGPAERECGTLPDAAHEDTVLADLALVEVACVLALAGAYLGNDSGITQIAGAVRSADGRATPTVVLFGPTDPRVWAPQGPHVRVIAAADGQIESITAEEVGEAVRALLIQ